MTPLRVKVVGMDETFTYTLTLPRPLAMGLITLVGVTLASGLVYLTLPEAKGEKGTLHRLRAAMGLSRLHPLVMLVGLVLYAALVGILILGLFGLIIDTLMASGRTNDYLFYVLRIGGLTAVLGAVVAFPFTLIRLRLTEAQTKTAQESLFNDKINEATKGLYARRQVTEARSDEAPTSLWQDDIVHRCASIDRLYRLASTERPQEALSVCELLANYVRVNFPILSETATDLPFERRQPRADLQVAITAIGQLNSLARPTAPSNWRLNLKFTDLDGVDFTSLDFAWSNFSNSRFEGARLGQANFDGALFNYSLLNCVECYGTDFTGAQFNHAKIPAQPGGWFAGFEMAASLRGANFTASDLSGIRHLSKVVLAETFGTQDTVLPQGLQFNREKVNLYDYHLYRDTEDVDQDDFEYSDLEEAVRNSGFQNWSPYASNDGTTGQFYKDLLKSLDMLNWPYWTE
ncbi:pentapeptide repeat-containing protein [Tateyamaria sp. SN6-1]|uniref:pentapeptide repeat-containing protein n=1 Tax=Tateyamaria sp. SN6-1 TaxID=3092148 RepID=UPI0039F518B6